MTFFYLFIYKGDEDRTTQGEHTEDKCGGSSSVTGVQSPRRDGLCAGTQLGAAQRPAALRGTLGRAASRPAEAVRSSEVGESCWRNFT